MFETHAPGGRSTIPRVGMMAQGNRIKFVTEF
jgi:hypothetical protein